MVPHTIGLKCLEVDRRIFCLALGRVEVEPFDWLHSFVSWWMIQVTAAVVIESTRDSLHRFLANNQVKLAEQDAETFDIVEATRSDLRTSNMKEGFRTV